MDKIICLGKNYPNHAKELGEAQPSRPVIFIKPPSVLVQGDWDTDSALSCPRGRGEVHHECEIVLRLKKGFISEVSLGLDMTLRDEQAHLKKAGHPWTLSKVFAHSAFVCGWIPVQAFPNYLETEFSFEVNGKPRQRGIGRSMFSSPDTSLDYLGKLLPLCDGDIVFTGTPSGVGPVVVGDRGVLHWDNRKCFVHWT